MNEFKSDYKAENLCRTNYSGKLGLRSNLNLKVFLDLFHFQFSLVFNNIQWFQFLANKLFEVYARFKVIYKNCLLYYSMFTSHVHTILYFIHVQQHPTICFLQTVEFIHVCDSIQLSYSYLQNEQKSIKLVIYSALFLQNRAHFSTYL